MTTEAPPQSKGKNAQKTVIVPAHWDVDEKGNSVWVEEKEMVPPPAPPPGKKTERDKWVPSDWKPTKDGQWEYVLGHWETPPEVPVRPPFKPRKVRAKTMGFYPAGPIDPRTGNRAHMLIMGAYFDPDGTRQFGQEFTLISEESFSSSWMEEITAENSVKPPADIPMTTVSQRVSSSPQQNQDGSFDQQTKRL